MITVAWYFDTFMFGGGEKVALDIIQGLLRSGSDIRPVVIARRLTKQLEGPEYIQLDTDARQHTAEGRAAIIKAVKKCGADIFVQSTNVRGGFLTELRQNIPDIRIILHLHNPPYWNVICKCAGNPVKTLREKLFRTYTKRYSRIYAEDYAAADCWVTLTDAYTEKLRNDLGDKVITMLNPLDYERLSQLQATPKRPEVLCVSRIDNAQKRIDRLLRAWGKIQDSRPGWRLKIVGEGPDRADLEKLAKELSLKNIEFVGHSDNPAEYYATASILCLTSEFEGWGLVLVEALAAGCRVLAMECSAGVSEIIRRGHGHGVPARDEKAFARELGRMMQEPGENGGEANEFLEQLGMENVAKRWHELFHSLMETSKTAAKTEKFAGNGEKV